MSLFNTNQEVFDAIAKHLLAQKTKSWDPRTKFCFYRHPTNGSKCAIGGIIPDELYRPEYERNSICNLSTEFHYTMFGLEVDAGLVSYLQDVHDMFEPEQWKSQLKKAARVYGLKWKN